MYVVAHQLVVKNLRLAISRIIIKSVYIVIWPWRNRNLFLDCFLALFINLFSHCLNSTIFSLEIFNDNEYKTQNQDPIVYRPPKLSFYYALYQIVIDLLCLSLLQLLNSSDMLPIAFSMFEYILVFVYVVSSCFYSQARHSL